MSATDRVDPNDPNAGLTPGAMNLPGRQPLGTVADDRLGKFFTEADDIIVEQADWQLSLTDGERLVLVQTLDQLRLWCEAQGVTLDDFLEWDIADTMPDSIRAELQG